MMQSYKEFISKSLLEDEESDSIYAVPDKTKAITVMNQVVSQLPSVVNNLKDISTKLESAALNNSKVKSAAESLEKYIETIKKELNS